jgi:hypothetical protein
MAVFLVMTATIVGFIVYMKFLKSLKVADIKNQKIRKQMYFDSLESLRQDVGSHEKMINAANMGRNWLLSVHRDNVDTETAVYMNNNEAIESRIKMDIDAILGTKRQAS